MSDQMDTDRGASVVGVLVVLVILGALAGLAFVALPTDPSGTSSRLEGLGPDLSAVRGGPASSTASTRPPSPVAGATTGSCATTARTVQTAVGAKQAADGVAPSSVSELVAGGWLSQAPALRGYELTLEQAGGRPTGKVLVNGLPAEQGCSVPPKSGP